MSLYALGADVALINGHVRAMIRRAYANRNQQNCAFGFVSPGSFLTLFYQLRSLHKTRRSEVARFRKRNRGSLPKVRSKGEMVMQSRSNVLDWPSKRSSKLIGGLINPEVVPVYNQTLDLLKTWTCRGAAKA
jgi:hypothetical protein